MIWFIVGIIITIIVIISCVLILKYLTKKDSDFVEVSDSFLSSIGKTYTSKRYAIEMFNLYTEILEEMQKENYPRLRDSLSDSNYNNFLILKKNERDKGITTKIEHFDLGFAKLIGFNIKDGLEIANIWIKYQCRDYVVRQSDGSVVGGSPEERVQKEEIISFFRTKTSTEKVVCSSCGVVLEIATKEKCPICEASIIEKKYHWVYLGNKNVTNK